MKEYTDPLGAKNAVTNSNWKVNSRNMNQSTQKKNHSTVHAVTRNSIYRSITSGMIKHFYVQSVTKNP